jgi:hypothetical protein
MFYEVIGHDTRRMSSNHPLELNRAVGGGRIEMFAVRDADYPGGWFYRFQYCRAKARYCATTMLTTTPNSESTTATFETVRIPKSNSAGS